MAEAIKKAKGGKKNRKYGRNAQFCLTYAAQQRREKNKAARLRKHLKRFPDDHCAASCLGRLQVLIR